MFKIETVPVFGDNFAYLVICEASGQAAAVDPADAEAVRQRASQLGVDLVAIWNTHHHFDHTGGNRDLLRHGELEVLAHASDRDRIPGMTRGLSHDQRFTLGKLEVQVLHTPGHTRGAICYRVGDALLTGDTLFGGGCGRLFEGDPPTMFHSVTAIIGELPDRIRLYFGHEYTAHNLAFAHEWEPGNPALAERRRQVDRARDQGRHTTPSTLAQERETNPFFRTQSPEIIDNLSRIHPADRWSPLRVFTRLREARDSW